MTRAAYRARLQGRRCFAGLDLSSTKDLTALVGVFPDADGTGFDVLSQFFVPHDSMAERGRRDRVPYEQWARDGYLIATPGNVVDYERVRAELKQWDAEFDLRGVACDPWNATDLVTRLQEQDGIACVMMRQGFASMSAPTKALEKAILGRELRHDGHPVLRWCVSNVAVETDAAGNLKPSKAKSTERIDGVVALVMALDQMNRQAIVPPSVYLTRGVLILGQ